MSEAGNKRIAQSCPVGRDITSILDGITLITTADAIDPTTTMAMVNILKAKVNAILAALQD